MPALWVTSSNHGRAAGPESGVWLIAGLALKTATSKVRNALHWDRRISSIVNGRIGFCYESLVALCDLKKLICWDVLEGLRRIGSRPAYDQLIDHRMTIEAEVLAQ